MSNDISCNYCLGNFVITSYSDSDGVYTYYSSDTNVAYFSNPYSNIVQFNNIGKSIITIKQDVSRNYVANDTSFNINILPDINYLLSFQIPTIQFIDTSFNLYSYTKNIISDASISYSIINSSVENVASIDSKKNITFNNGGTIQIKMIQSVSGNYLGRTINTDVITVPNRADLSFNIPSNQYINRSLNLMNYVSTNNLSAPINFKIIPYSTNVATIDSSNNIFFNNDGNIQVKAYIDASVNDYEMYSSNSKTISIIVNGVPTLTFLKNPTVYIGNSFDLCSNTVDQNYIGLSNCIYLYSNVNTGLPIIFTSVDTNHIASFDSVKNNVKFNKNGTFRLNASVVGNNIYPTLTASIDITVYPAATITYNGPTTVYNNNGIIFSNFIQTNSSGSITYSIVSGNNYTTLNNSYRGDISFSNISNTEDRTAKIQIYQSASGTFSAATISKNITIYQRSTIYFSQDLAIQTQTYRNNLFFSLKQYISSNSSGSLIFTKDDTNGISILTNGYLSINKIGTMTLYVLQDASGNYSANDSSIIINVSRGSVSFNHTWVNNLISKTYRDSNFDSEITINDSNSNLTVSDGTKTYSSSNISVDTIDPNSGFITINGAGTDTINILYTNPTKYYDNSVNFTLSVAKAGLNWSSFTFSIPDISYQYGKTISINNPNPSISLPGSSDFMYNYSTTSTDISINKITDNNFNIKVVNARKNIPINVSLISSKNYYTFDTSKTTFFNIDKMDTNQSDFVFSINDVSYNGGTFIVAAPTTTLMGATDFIYTYETTTSNLISVSKSTDGSCIVVESTTSNSVGIATITARLGSSFTNYNGGTKITKSFKIDKGYMPTRNMFSFLPISDVSFVKDGSFIINPPLPINLSGSTDFSFNYKTTSTDICLNLITATNQCDVSLIQTGRLEQIVAVLTKSSNYVVGTEISYNTFTIDKGNMPPTNKFTFSISDVSYQYDGSFIINPPTTTLPGSFTYTYTNLYSNPAISIFSTDVSKISINTAGNSIAVQARVSDSKNYIAGTDVSTTFIIRKLAAPLPSSFSFPISDVSYTGGTFYIAAPTTTLLGATDFSYTYTTTTPNLISVYNSIDGSCIVVESTRSNSVGQASITATLGSSFTNYNGGTTITTNFNINKGYMPLRSVFSVSTISDISFIQDGYFIVNPPVAINLSGSSDFSFNYITSNTDICLNYIASNNTCDVSLVQTGTSSKPIVAVLTGSTNYVVGTEISYNLFSIQPGNMPPSNKFQFSISDVSYQYGGNIIISPPTTTLPGYFTYTYTNLYSNPAITLIGSNIDINTAGNLITVNAKVLSSKNYVSGTDIPTTFTIRKLAAPQSSSFTFRQNDVSYTGGTYIIPAPTTTLPGSSDFYFDYTVVSSNILVSKSLDGSCVLTESTANNSVGPARLQAILGTPINYVGGTIIDLSYTIDKGHQPRTSDLTGKIMVDAPYSLTGRIELSTPTTTLSGASDFTYHYSIVSDPSNGISAINDDNNKGDVRMNQLASNILLKATLIESSNYDVNGTGKYTDLSFNSFNIVKNSAFEILATDFDFIVPTTTTYQYGTVYKLPQPQLSSNGLTRLSGLFNFEYSVVETSPSINDISVNLNIDKLSCDMSINQIGMSRTDTSATVFINATLKGSSNFNIPNTVPVIKSNAINIVKKPIVQSDIASYFTFNIADVSYTGGTFTVPGPRSTLPGSDFSYNYVLGSGPITVGTAEDGSCIIQQKNQVNVVGSANVIAKINSSMRYDISNINNNNLLNKSFTIQKGNALAIQLSDISWTPLQTQTFSYGGSFILPNPIVSVSGANDMSFSFTTSSKAITINTNNKDVSINSASTISIDISATLSASTNYDISKPLKFSLNTFTINKAAAPTVNLFTLSRQTYGTLPYTFTAPTLISSDPSLSNPNPVFTYSSNNTSVASFSNINNPIISINSAGTAIITATFAGTSNYNGGTNITQLINIVPTQPTMTIKYIKANQFDISINSPIEIGVSGYYYSTTTPANYSSIQTSPYMTITNGILSDTSYTVSVFAGSNGGNSIASNTQTVLTLPSDPIYIPTAFTNYIDVSMISPIRSGLQYYYGISGGTYTYSSKTSLTDYSFNNLTTGITYNISVIANNTTGNSNPIISSVSTSFRSSYIAIEIDNSCSITLNNSKTVYYILVGGGGSSGSAVGNPNGQGGGGAGGVMSGIINQTATTTYNFIIGDGGPSASSISNNNPIGNNGNKSTMTYDGIVITASGGNAGGSSNGNNPGAQPYYSINLGSNYNNIREIGAPTRGGDVGTKVQDISGYTVYINDISYNMAGGGGGGNSNDSTGASNVYGSGIGSTSGVTYPTNGRINSGSGGGGDRSGSGNNNNTTGGSGVGYLIFMNDNFCKQYLFNLNDLSTDRKSVLCNSINNYDAAVYESTTPGTVTDRTIWIERSNIVSDYPSYFAITSFDVSGILHIFSTGKYNLLMNTYATSNFSNGFSITGFFKFMDKTGIFIYISDSLDGLYDFVSRTNVIYFASTGSNQTLYIKKNYDTNTNQGDFSYKLHENGVYYGHWCHLAIVFNNRSLSVYLNNRLINETNNNNSFGSNYTDFIPKYLVVGNRYKNGSNAEFYCHNLKIYNYSITSTVVSNDFYDHS
jgi:hypothetical protein